RHEGERMRPGPRRRSRWPYIVGGAAVVLLIVVLIAASGGGDDGGSTASDGDAAAARNDTLVVATRKTPDGIDGEFFYGQEDQTIRNAAYSRLLNLPETSS